MNNLKRTIYAIKRNRFFLFYFLLCVGIIFLAPSCKKEKLPLEIDSICFVTDEIKAHFDSTAVHIYAQEVHSNSTHPGYTEKTFDQTAIDSILKKLSAIYKATEKSDDLTNMIFAYGIQSHIGYSLSDIMVTFSDTTLYESVVANPGASGETVLDDLVNVHGFDDITAYPDLNAAMFSADSMKNIQAFLGGIEAINGVSSATENLALGLSTNIEHTVNGGVDEFLFSYGWGDCPAGCINWHYWTVQVDEKCNVTIVSESGDNLP